MALTAAQKKKLAAKIAEQNAAADESAKVADELTDPILKSIHARAQEQRKVLDDLELTDPETYETLKRIVNEETRKNVAISNIVERVQALGAAGKKAAASISKLTGAGALAAVGQALGKRK